MFHKLVVSMIHKQNKKKLNAVSPSVAVNQQITETVEDMYIILD